MKLLQTTFAAALVLLSSSATAFDMPWDDNDHRDRWRGDNRWDNSFDIFDDIWGDMFGDMAGDFDFQITIRANADGWGRGRGRGRRDQYWRGDNRYYGDHRYYSDHRSYGGRYGPHGPRHPRFYGAPPPRTVPQQAGHARPPQASAAGSPKARSARPAGAAPQTARPYPAPVYRPPSYRPPPFAPRTRAPSARNTAQQQPRTPAKTADHEVHWGSQQPPWATNPPSQTAE